MAAAFPELSASANAIQAFGGLPEFKNALTALHAWLAQFRNLTNQDVLDEALCGDDLTPADADLILCLRALLQSP